MYVSISVFIGYAILYFDWIPLTALDLYLGTFLFNLRRQPASVTFNNSSYFLRFRQCYFYVVHETVLNANYCNGSRYGHSAYLGVSSRCKLFIFFVIDAQSHLVPSGCTQGVSLKFVHRWIQASHHLYRDRTKKQAGDYLLFRFERADANRTGRYFAVRGSRAVKCTGRLAAHPLLSPSLCFLTCRCTCKMEIRRVF